MASRPERAGYRGYISSRPFMGERAAQHVQNIVITNYAERENLRYLLSATEYAMPNCFMMMEQVLEELPLLEGVICYSLFMLPRQSAQREVIYHAVIDAKASMHFAVERLVLRSDTEIPDIEAIWLMRNILPHCPKELPAWN
jgi:sporadic carbohydrate cluster protein (TIGR04323 family)